MYKITNNNFNAELKIEFGKLETIVKWCSQNCLQDWGYEVLYPAGREEGEYKFFFIDRDDYINFLLWQK